MASSDVDFESLGGDKDLREFLASEQQKMEFQQQINKFTDICWDKCIGDKTLSSKFDRKTESCLTNCVGRFVDTTLLVAKRFNQIVQQGHQN